MKIHYFQRYHKKEDVSTANTMLLLSRLYSYSPDKFFRLLKSFFFSDSFNPEITFSLQEKGRKSVPDATISQESFKIVVETKLFDWFYKEQLEKHLLSFKDEKFKVFMTLAPTHMAKAKKTDFESELKEYNKRQKYPVIHINTTFEEIVTAIQEILDERDYEMHEVLEDYIIYCENDNLMASSNAWKLMRMKLTGKTYEFNVENDVYYDSVEHGFRAHGYLGLYKEKSIRAVGKIEAIITAVVDENDELVYNAEKGELTDERKQKILKAIADGANYGYDMTGERYFFVEKFYETDFRKTSPGASMGTKFFDLSEIISVGKKTPTKEIAEMLKSVTWE